MTPLQLLALAVAAAQLAQKLIADGRAKTTEEEAARFKDALAEAAAEDQRFDAPPK